MHTILEKRRREEGRKNRATSDEFPHDCIFRNEKGENLAEICE